MNKVIETKYPTIFNNIVGIIKLSEFFEFRLDAEIVPDTARYFIIKKGLRVFIDEETGEEKREYLSGVYVTGKHKDWDEDIDIPRYLNLWGFWKFSSNGSDFLNEEMIEIDMDK